MYKVLYLNNSVLEMKGIPLTSQELGWYLHPAGIHRTVSQQAAHANVCTELMDIFSITVFFFGCFFISLSLGHW